MGPALVALLYLVPGAPGVVDGPDHEAGCYLGNYTGGETRLVYDGPPEAPFYVGTPGALVRDGVASVAAGVPPDAEGVTVHAAEVYEVTRECSVPDLYAEDPTASGIVLNEGVVFVLRAEDCDDSGICEATVGGVSFSMVPGACEARRLPSRVDEAQLGWWVPATREGVEGWVRGDAGFRVEARCTGPDEGAPASLTRWHRV